MWSNSSGAAGCALQCQAELVEQRAPAVLTTARVIIAVEERPPLLSEAQSRAGVFALKLYRGEGHRCPEVIEVHVISVDDAFVRHDVVAVGSE